jgi:FeS assembly SUF system protein
MKPYASEEMVRNALGDAGFDELAMPPNAEVPTSHPLWPKIDAALREVYDPEIPVNVFELGLIYKVELIENEAGSFDVDVKMTLTSPACPVAQEMPGMVQSAIFPVEGVGDVEVEIIWEPTWDPSMMAETAKLQLNMFT